MNGLLSCAVCFGDPESSITIGAQWGVGVLFAMCVATLAVLTVVTVGVSYLDVATHIAIGIALAIASVKAGLVAAYFMHLVSERAIIYYILGLTMIFCCVMMGIILATVTEMPW